MLAAAMLPGTAHGQSKPTGDALASAAEATPSTAPPAEYARLMREGLRAFHAGRWAEARALFLRGHQVSPNARSFRVLGMTAFNLEQYASAVRELSAALEDGRRPLSESLRAQAQSLLSRADIFVGRYRLSLDPDTTVLWIDGVSARYELDGSLLLSVGEHVLEAEAVSYRSLTRPILVDGTDGETLRFHLSPLPSLPEPPPVPFARSSVGAEPSAAVTGTSRVDSSRRERVRRVFSNYAFTWSAAAGALGFAGAATGFYVQAQRETDRIEDDCAGQCHPWEDLDLSRRDHSLRLSQGMLAGALICSVGALVAYVIERRHARH